MEDRRESERSCGMMLASAVTAAAAPPPPPPPPARYSCGLSWITNGRHAKLIVNLTPTLSNLSREFLAR
ncbi:hypothetical protein M0804_007889 [Polistes exclamans]|nr:hypothetical protein M0804_007889 [Polistes exclamans]